MGSADWMSRNLHRRVEIAVPIEEKTHKERCWQIFQVMLSDERQAWDMRGDGSYSRRIAEDPNFSVGTHEVLMGLMASS